MVDVNSPRQALTVYLPTDLLAELRILADEKEVAVDEIVMEACLDYTEPYSWQRDYQEWLRAHPDERPSEFGIDGNDLRPPDSEEGRE